MGVRLRVPRTDKHVINSSMVVWLPDDLIGNRLGVWIVSRPGIPWPFSTHTPSILRWIHLIFTIPILDYIYGEASEVQQYAAAVRSYSSPSLALQYGSVHIACLDLGGYLESGRAIHRAEDLDDDSCATFTLATIEKLAVRSKQKYEQYH
jgi:hypothetical protein